jgi:predicted DsbA family dithiol-disulfide isomerase
MAKSMMKISIDVISDVICPWCFLGKHRLDRALAALPEVQAEVAWRPFFLDPTIPAEGIDRRTYLVGKFGEERLATLHAPFEEAREKEGVPYDFDKITRTPNTLDAHRLMRWSQMEGKQQGVAERLFLAYWSEGRDVGDREVLSAVANEAGMDGAQVAERLATNADVEKVFAEARQAITMGVQGVPCFILAQKYGLSGAQPVETLVDAISKAATPA